MRIRLQVACLLVWIAACGAAPEPAFESAVAAVVLGVQRDAAGNLVLLLEEEGGERLLPIWIGMAEAQSIAAELEHVQLPRPNTHDLAGDLLSTLGAELERVVVSELRGSTYYASLVVRRDGRRFEIDSRPSDAVALALRADVPIFVNAPLFAVHEREALLDDDAPRVGL
jgi:bifunctional DNase/RNase